MLHWNFEVRKINAYAIVVGEKILAIVLKRDAFLYEVPGSP